MTDTEKSDSPRTPHVGDIVLYYAYGSPGGEYPAEVARAAIITEVMPLQRASGKPLVSLCVLNPTGLFFNQHVPQWTRGAANRAGTWGWMQ